MVEIDRYPTTAAAFSEAASLYGDQPLFVIPANDSRSYAQAGLSISYAQMAQVIQQVQQAYAEAGYGFPHHVALLLDNRPDHIVHKFALNALGVCCVPVNPSYRAAELAFLFDHSQPQLLVALPEYQDLITEALGLAQHQPRIWFLGSDDAFPLPSQKAQSHQVTGETPASILYTSGTTGRPKGCVLSQRYELASGDWYARKGGLIQIREGQDRLYNPLPLFHINSSVLSFFCMMLTGNAQIQSDRFQPSRWWQEVVETQATIVHYLGVIIPLLLKQPVSELETQHQVRFGHGAGVEPQLHEAFEKRFGFPLVELWGMTEVVRVFTVNEAPRKLGSRAFGRPCKGLEVKVAGPDGQELGPGEQGEMLLRYSAETPRKDFFSGYLNDPEATEKAWQGGWFHTGDRVYYDGDDGMLHFVDRDKNIIRRSGENIAAAEVEALLLTHPSVRQVAVMAVPDAIREAEVLACIELREELAAQMTTATAEQRRQLAEEIFAFVHSQLAYYKAPGWMWFTPQIPTTGTQKIQKHRIFHQEISDPTQLEGMIDLRALKKRT